MSKCLEQGSTDDGAARKQEADGDDPECRIPMESIVSEALKIIKSLSGMSWKTAKPHSMIVVAYTAASFMVPIIRSGFPAP